VKVQDGKDEVEEDVVATEIGAQPPKVVIEKGAALKKPGGQRPKPTTIPKGIEPKFE